VLLLCASGMELVLVDRPGPSPSLSRDPMERDLNMLTEKYTLPALGSANDVMTGRWQWDKGSLQDHLSGAIRNTLMM